MFEDKIAEYEEMMRKIFLSEFYHHYYFEMEENKNG